MARWIRIAETYCKDPARESEFLDWYKAVHIPDILASPIGILSGQLYECPDAASGEARYLAVYEFETDDIDNTLSIQMDYVKALPEKGRMSDLLQLVSMRTFKKIY